MQLQSKLTILLLSGVLAVLTQVGGNGLPKAHAQSPTPDPGNSANPAAQAPSDPNPGLKLAPVKYEETVEPGQAKDGVITVLNTSSRPLTVQPEIENIRMTGDNGTLDFYIGDNPFRLHAFVQIDKAPFVLNVGEGRNVKFRVTIPGGTYPGGYFGSILFKLLPSGEAQGSAQVAQGGRVGSLLILSVAGEADRRGSVKEAKLTQNGFSERKAFEINYANTGNTDQRPLGVAFKPVGSLTIRNTFGSKVVDQRLTGETVFPGAARKFETKTSKPLWFGRYQAQVSLAPGEGQKADSKTVTFWAVSPLALALFVLIAGLLAALTFEGFRRRKRPDTVRPTSSLSRHFGQSQKATGGFSKVPSEPNHSPEASPTKGERSKHKDDGSPAPPKQP